MSPARAHVAGVAPRMAGVVAFAMLRHPAAGTRPDSGCCCIDADEECGAREADLSAQ